MGVRANEDEFGSFDPDEIDDAGTIGNAKAPASGDDDGLESSASGGPRRTYHDEAVARRNDVSTRLRNFLKYLLWMRLGTEMPMRAFVVPEGSAVAGNAFSDFISSIVPATATAYTGADAALSVTLQEGASGSLGALATKVAATSLSPIPQGGISLFHVGIGPFIAASIAMSVLTATVPSLKELTKDAVGQHTVKQYTRYITLAVAVVQSYITAVNLKPYCALGFESKTYAVAATLFFTCGALAAAWLADEMTDRGLGQGTSVMITVSVCGAYVSALRHYFTQLLTVSFAQILPFILAATALTAGSVLVQTGTCRVPIAYFQGPAIPGLPRVVREEIDHVPFKINPLGMQPVLVAVFLCEGAMWLVNALSDNGTKWPEWALNLAACAFSSASGSVAYYVIFFATVFGFSYLDLQNTPKEVAEYMTKIGARVPNVRPGEQTARHLEELQRGSRFFGGLLLAIVATACAYADAHMRRTTGICVGFTSMLIVTSTIMQMKRQMSAMAQMPRLDKVMDGL
jgi:preprotein translocase subunit SecY